MKKTLLFLVVLFLSLPLLQVQAQEAHFSLFNQAPLNLNPALTGAFSGTVRLGGIYRDQYRGVLSNRFATPMFYVDAPIVLVGKKKRDWLGVGFQAMQDKAGIAGLQTGSYQLSVALHHLLNEKGNTVLSFGLQGGSLQRKIDLNNADVKFGDEYNSNTGSFTVGTGLDSGKGRDASAFDLGAGLFLKSRTSEVMAYRLGFSVGHLLQPSLSVISTGDQQLGMRLQGVAGLDYDIRPRFRLSPALYYSGLGTANQVQLQAWGGYLIQQEKDIRLNFGLGYRFGDAGEVLLGVDVKGLKVGLSYDMTFSDLRNVQTGGAFEIAASYIARNYRQPEVKPVILCPEL